MEKLGSFLDRLQFGRLQFGRPQFGAPRTRRGSVLAWLAAALDRQRQRDVLATLDDRALGDIGISREEARAEASKPFWR